MTENGNGELGWVFDETKACAKTVAERRRLAKARNERTTAKERLEKAHREDQRAMSAALAAKKRRLAKAREYAIEVKLGFQKDSSSEEEVRKDGLVRRRIEGRKCPDCGGPLYTVNALLMSEEAAKHLECGWCGKWVLNDGGRMTRLTPMAREPSPEEREPEDADEDG